MITQSSRTIRTANFSVAVDSKKISGAARMCMFMVMAGFTVFDRFGLNFGDYSVDFSLIAQYMLVAVLFLGGALTIGIPSAVIFFGAVVIGLVGCLLNFEGVSIPSFCLFLVIYLPFLFNLRSDVNVEEFWRWSARLFTDVVAFCAICGTIQFFAQFVIHDGWLFDFTDSLPDAIKGNGGYNTVIPVDTLYKSNGFFFREPSGFSQTVAIAMLYEIAIFKRLTRIVLLGIALILSYSGTGIAMLLFGLLFPLRLKTFLRLALLAAAAGVIFVLFGDTLNLSFTLARIDEFDQRGSSAFARFIAPFLTLEQGLRSHPWSVFVGNGPGTITAAVRNASDLEPTFDPTWAKLFYEYGLFGFICFIYFMFSRVIRIRVPAELRAALFFSWLVLGGHLLTPGKTTEVYVLITLFAGNSFVARRPTNTIATAWPRQRQLRRSSRSDFRSK